MKSDILRTAVNTADWRKVIQSAPPERVGHAVTMAVSGTVPQACVEPHLGCAITGLTPQQQSSAIQMIIAELEKEGFNRETIRQGTFVRELDPYRMSSQEINALVYWTGQQHPQVLARIAACFQEEPEVLQGLLGDRVMMAVASSLGASAPQDGIHSTR